MEREDGMIDYPAKRTMAPVCLLLIASGALAQQSVVDRCRQTPTDTDRIECLEAALLDKDLATPDAEPEPAAEGPTLASHDELPAAGVEADTAPDGIGAEQVAKRTQTLDEQENALEKELGLVVAKYEWVPYERLVVTFENGQVWRQIKGDTTRIRTSLERNQTADITESGLGGYKLRLNEIRRTIRVERIY